MLGIVETQFVEGLLLGLRWCASVAMFEQGNTGLPHGLEPERRRIARLIDCIYVTMVVHLCEG